jgi:hypothetical protein
MDETGTPWPPEGLTETEVAVLSLTLNGAGEIRAAVRRQLSHASLKPRKLTGAGFYRDFVIPADARIPRDLPRIVFAMSPRNTPTSRAAPCSRSFLRDGIVSFLEGVTFAGPWPADEASFTFFLDPQSHESVG